MHTVHLTEVYRASPLGTLDAVTDLVIDNLVTQQDALIFDADVSAELTTGLVEISIVSRGDDCDQTVTRGRSVIWKAIAAAGELHEKQGASPVRFEKQSSRSALLIQA
jgi:hypothetical protein